MKYGFILFMLVFLVGCNGQSNIKLKEESSNEAKWSDKKELEAIFEKDLRDMVAAYNAGDFATGADYMPEELFNYATREQVVAELEMMETMGISMKFSGFELKEVSEVVNHEGKYYARIENSSKATIVFDEMARYQMDAFTSAYDEEVIEKDTDSSLILLSNDVNYAMVGEDSQIWKYLRYDEGMKTIINRIVPAQVRIALD